MLFNIFWKEACDVDGVTVSPKALYHALRSRYKVSYQSYGQHYSVVYVVK